MKRKIDVRNDLDFMPSYADSCPPHLRRTFKAEIVDVAPHLANVATFVLHESAERFGEDTYDVSNLETGLCIKHILAETREEAIEFAKEFLADKDEKKMLLAYKKAGL